MYKSDCAAVKAKRSSSNYRCYFWSVLGEDQKKKSLRKAVVAFSVNLTEKGLCLYLVAFYPYSKVGSTKMFGSIEAK